MGVAGGWIGMFEDVMMVTYQISIHVMGEQGTSLMSKESLMCSATMWLLLCSIFIIVQWVTAKGRRLKRRVR